MADAKYQMENGSYPINNCADVSDAAKLAHHSKTYSFEQVKAHVLRAKAALGCGDVLPESWETGNDNDADDKPKRSANSEGGHIRSMAFEIVPQADGQTLEGYAAVFNTSAHVRDWAGEYDEEFTRDAFTRTLREKTPDLLFEHGKHPLIGKMPLGVFDVIQPDSKGLYVRARLSDNWLIQPVRDAVRDGAITGMSVNFVPYEGGEKWSHQSGSLRHIVHDTRLRELGPTLSPVYTATTASIRSILERLPDVTGQPDTGSVGGGDHDRSDVTPGNGVPSPEQLSAMRSRDRELRIRGIIHVKS